MNTEKRPVTGPGFAHPENSVKVISYSSIAALVPVIPGNIGDNQTHIVSARTLHEALGVKRDFTTWIKDRIRRYGFVEGVDYVVVENLTSPVLGRSKSRQRVEHDYLITLNMGKEIAMVERSEQGRTIRRYFIKCEEELHKAAPEKAAALRRELKARLTVASYFKPMCAALDLQRAETGKATQPHHYTTEANMLARIVTGGMTAKQWAQSNGVTGDPRDHMNALQLEHLSYLEQSNITLIELGQDYHQRKAELMRLSQRWLARHMEADHD
ncbi:antA/AntB antirepressor family protein [Salmonella enterica]|uniref:AntA/AntB antirepressor family protein n=3 Tax=Salmonella enterica TaxID=28901 RepID=A0A8F0CY44_SALER|nr:antA/AntB antirepressor family protein [Salmonella enterica]EBA1914390.1 antA/AntB antirepressor family protein [Salmonella enterica]EBP0194934.1 antA/AntB antirepressor family protein [Salmonella enterica]EBP0213729.1 antA/AntB antirepressor family protein [Salmonella enterica]EBQ6307954.1 antA/AntB antirepressor family protein [Salmonella enterica]EBU2796925.1 antA/AntB antirepressor family protein [Salmonella enterica]